MERSLVIVYITDPPQCETSITHDAMLTPGILKIESLQRNGTLWHPLEIQRCKKSFLQKCHFAEWAGSKSALLWGLAVWSVASWAVDNLKII